MPHNVEIALRHIVAMEHPRWTWNQITAAVGEAKEGQGPYALLAADLLAAQES